MTLVIFKKDINGNNAMAGDTYATIDGKISMRDVNKVVSSETALIGMAGYLDSTVLTHVVDAINEIFEEVEEDALSKHMAYNLKLHLKTLFEDKDIMFGTDFLIYIKTTDQLFEICSYEQNKTITCVEFTGDDKNFACIGSGAEVAMVLNESGINDFSEFFRITNRIDPTISADFFEAK